MVAMSENVMRRKEFVGAARFYYTIERKRIRRRRKKRGLIRFLISIVRVVGENGEWKTEKGKRVFSSVSLI